MKLPSMIRKFQEAILCERLPIVAIIVEIRDFDGLPKHDRNSSEAVVAIMNDAHIMFNFRAFLSRLARPWHGAKTMNLRAIQAIHTRQKTA
jgi:hypothetical protein